MSNRIFVPPGALAWDVKKRPRYATIVQNTRSARGQLRIAQQQYPIWEFEFDWNLLRGGEQSDIATYNTLQAMMGFFGACLGAYDDFLYSDPNDNSVTGEPFGAGDGSTAAFQLQRNIGSMTDIVQNLDQSVNPPKIYKYDWQGRKNLLVASEDLTQANWQKNTGIVVTPAAGFSPDGACAASKITYNGTGAAGSFRVWQNAQLEGGNFVPSASETFSISVWLRSDTPLSIRIDTNFAVFKTVNLTNQWQRVSMLGQVGNGTNIAQLVIYSLAADNSPFTIYAWGGQLEMGSAMTAYQKTSNANTWGPLFQAGTFVRKNWILQSNGFDQAAWNKTNVTVTPNAITAPDGSNNAFKLAATATAATSCNQVANGSGLAAANTYSIFVKKGSGATQANSFVLRNATTSTNLLSVTVNYDTGAITYITGSTGVTMYKMPNGWWRLSMTATSGISNGDNIQVYAGFIGNSETAGVFCYVFGAQLEQYGFNNSATPYPWTGAGGAAGGGGSAYIPTTSATVTVTDYSLGSTGIVTFAAAPANAALLTWDGSYYYRLRFAEDINEWNQFMYQLWELRSVKFESVIL